MTGWLYLITQLACHAYTFDAIILAYQARYWSGIVSRMIMFNWIWRNLVGVIPDVNVVHVVRCGSQYSLPCTRLFLLVLICLIQYAHTLHLGDGCYVKLLSVGYCCRLVCSMVTCRYRQACEGWSCGCRKHGRSGCCAATIWLLCSNRLAYVGGNCSQTSLNGRHGFLFSNGRHSIRFLSYFLIVFYNFHIQPVLDVFRKWLS